MAQLGFIKKIVFGALIFSLCLPYIQTKLTIVKQLPLNGVFEKANDPTFKSKDWFEGEYQKGYSNFIDQNVGFRNFFIRLFNQINYSIFNVSNREHVVLGKEGYLFEQPYFDFSHGKHYENDSIYREKLTTLAQAQDILKSKGIDLITILAPTKARFFSEYADEFNARSEKKYTHYDYLKGHYRELGLNVIDFNKWFMETKSTSPYPLFPKQGIHWSYYGAAKVVDSLIHYFEITHHARMNDYAYSIVPDTLVGTDYDLGDLMNLFFKMEPNKMAYPKFTFSSAPERWKPRILVIGDSFNWTLYNWAIFKNLGCENAYWYYNSTIYPGEGHTEDIDTKKEALKYDIILLLQSEPGYSNPGYLFAERLVSNAEHSKKYSAEFNVKIRSTKFLITAAIEKSKSENRKLDDVVLEMADSLAEIKEARLTAIEHQIRNSPEWFEQIKQKAKDNNKSLEEMMKTDANWLYEQETAKK